MSSSRSMSTDQIKRGLENIKKAQLEVLKQLRGDSLKQMRGETVLVDENSSRIQKLNTLKRQQPYQTLQINENSQNIQMHANMERKSPLQKNNSNSVRRQYQGNYQKSIKTNQSSSSLSLSTQNYQALRRQFASEREELNNKVREISSKLSILQKQSKNVKNQARAQDNEFNTQIKNLKHQNNKLQSIIRTKTQQIQHLEKNQNNSKAQLQLKTKQKTILQTQIKSLKAQNTQLGRKIKQLQMQLKEQTILTKELREENEQLKTQQSRLNMDLVMKEVKSISHTHDFLFNKLKQSTTIEMSWVEKQSQIQNCFSRLLEYFESLSSSGSGNYLSINEDNINSSNNNHNHYPNRISQLNNQSKQVIKRSMISESRAQEQSQLQYFVRQMGDHFSRKEVNQLIQQNQALKRKLRQISLELANTSSPGNIHNAKSNNKYSSQSNRLINLELQEMREQVTKFKRYKQQIKQEQQEQEKQILKHKIKSRELQSKIETTQRKLTQATNSRFSLQKKCQEQSIQITSLNSIIKQLNTKLYPSPQAESPLSQVRHQFTKLLQTNSLLQRQKQSLRAMNQGLQVQIQNLKCEKDQFEANNKQKHQLIEREIRERNHLIQEIQKKELKSKHLKDQMEKLKIALTLNDQNALKARKNFEDLLQQKNQEILQLRKEIEELYKQSREYHQLRFKFEKLQMEYKQLSRKSVKMGETLTHLWSVKEAQYHNVNQILGMFKNTDYNTQNQNSGHF